MSIVLTGGDIFWDRAAGDFDWSRSTALPALLSRRLADEPLFVEQSEFTAQRLAASPDGR